jgi:RHS repeat-associated protein
MSAVDYDRWGNVVRSTDPMGTWTATEYDGVYGLFPEKVCNALFCSRAWWDPALGVATATMDANTQITRFDHDAFGRATTVTRPDAGVTETQYLDWGVTTGPVAQRQRVRTETSTGSAGGVLASEAWVDGLGRTYRTVDEGGVTRDVEYVDTSARPSRQSNPYGPGEVPVWTVFTYDAAKRPISVQAPDGSGVQTVYAVGSVTSRDQLGAETVRHLDEFGRVVTVEERLRPCPTCAPAGSVTTYRYDALSRLVSITDPAGNASTNDWDALGRNLKRCDPDRGCQGWTYRDDGLPRTRTDAMGQVTRWSYDAIGRPSTREELDPAGVVTRTVTQIYDRDPGTGATQGHSLGHLLREEDTAGTATSSEAFWYDAVGRVERTEKCVDAHCSELGYAFDPTGRLTTLTYPDASGALTAASERVAYTYDAAGRLASVGGYVTTLSYDAAGLPTHIGYANGVETQLDYDPARLWLDKIEVSHPAQGQYFLADYHHDPAGRIDHEVVHDPTLVEQDFAYDELGRLVTVGSPDPRLRQQFAYNPIGNMVWNSLLGDYHYTDPAHAHAVTKTDNGETYAYDANGNMTQARGMMIAWTPDDRVRSIANPSTGVERTFAYDASGQRVRETTPGGTTFTFGRYVERDPAGGLVKYYWAGDLLVARRDAAGVVYFHQDQTHSTRLVTDAAGVVVNRYRYAAYGAKQSGSETVANDVTTFGGRDAGGEFGLVYMNARWYDPRLGKFLSADSIIPVPYDPQALNRYAYVLNDPVNYWDPSGHRPISTEARARNVQYRKETAAQARRAFVSVYTSPPCNPGFTGCDADPLNPRTAMEVYERMQRERAYLNQIHEYAEGNTSRQEARRGKAHSGVEAAGGGVDSLLEVSTRISGDRGLLLAGPYADPMTDPSDPSWAQVRELDEQLKVLQWEQDEANRDFEEANARMMGEFWGWFAAFTEVWSGWFYNPEDFIDTTTKYVDATEAEKKFGRAKDEYNAAWSRLQDVQQRTKATSEARESAYRAATVDYKDCGSRVCR